MFAGCRRLLRPVLAVDPLEVRARRRPPMETGPIGLRGLEVQMYLDNERRPTMTPQLAFRVAVIGGVALLAFAIIFFRLWYLQVLSGDKYEAQARGNVVREIKVQAPRGEIVDRDGNVLVDNRSGSRSSSARTSCRRTRPSAARSTSGSRSYCG